MADLARRLGRQKRLQRAAGRGHLLQLREGRVVHLIQVDVIRAQVAQADLDIPLHLRPRARHGFGRQHEFLAQAALQRLAQKRFADRVAARGINVIHAALDQSLHQFARNGRIHLLNRDAAKAHARHAQTGLAQCRIFHMYALPVFSLDACKKD